MKTRLGIFIAALLLLPLAGLFLSGTEWGELAARNASASENIPATLLTTLMLLGYVYLSNHLIWLNTGSNPLKLQRNYFLAMAGASAALGWLLAYLNLFAASWTTQPGNPLVQLLLYTPLFALLAPAVLGTRALLGTFPGLLRRLARGIPLPAASAETTAFTLVPVTIAGLLGGAAWPTGLFWLLWLAPLLLLVALQLLWHEATIFGSLKTGDWGRVICAALGGLITGNLAVITYLMNSGSLEIHLPNPLFAQLGFAVFGLLCLQLGDVVAEHWRGKQRSELFQQKKKFPIPVVVKKS
ncbi:MAG TPA: hypothetical protein VFW53_01030 [Gallionella sp.]|nr:hypothetical protein [Gallionella sp.]